jgi:GNAT superfamily N-acetyltransferase
MNGPSLTIRAYEVQYRADVRTIYGNDEFARPRLMQKHPRMCHYLADSLSHYFDPQPQSTFLAEVDDQVVGALLGTLDTEKCESIFRNRIRLLLIKRTLLGSYGWPGFLISILETHLASFHANRPHVNFDHCPAHLHIGLLPNWRRKGIGSALMSAFETYLQHQNVPGYHLYASSFHPQGIAFYRKLNLKALADFQWRFHNRFEWLDVTENIFVKSL